MTKFERSYNGRAMRSVKRILDLGLSAPQSLPPTLSGAEEGYFESFKHTSMWLALVFGLCLIASCEAPAHAYTDEQYVNAIYLAEGGIHAKHSFGISNAKCSTFQAAKKYAQELCGIIKRDTRNMDLKDIHDLYNSLDRAIALLQEEISRRAKSV